MLERRPRAASTRPRLLRLPLLGAEATRGVVRREPIEPERQDVVHAGVHHNGIGIEAEALAPQTLFVADRIEPLEPEVHDLYAPTTGECAAQMRVDRVVIVDQIAVARRSAEEHHAIGARGLRHRDLRPAEPERVHAGDDAVREP